MPASTRTSTAVVILGVLFFLFGFVTWVNGPLMSYLKMACELEGPVLIFLVTFAFYIAYFVTALPMSWIMRRTGLRNGMMLGLLIMAAGALLFVPAAGTRAYPLFLAGLFTIGTGLSMLQTASNPYITVVGPIESAAARISIMGICNKAAGMLAPFVVGFFLLGDATAIERELQSLVGAAREARLEELATRVIAPYIGMAVVLVLLGIGIRFAPLPELEVEQEEKHAARDGRTIFSFPKLLLGVVAIFLYVGVEVMAGDSIGPYGTSIGIPLDEAKLFTSYTLAAMIAGYIIGIVCIPRFFSQSAALTASAVVGVLLTVAVVLLPGYASVLSLALLGLANALVWPAVWPLAIDGLGRHTKTGSALLIMGIAGGALLPLLYAWLGSKGSIGLQNAYLLMIPCYLFIGWYGLWARPSKAV
ncbi:MAG: sugar MFS transporter [Flavobacteriales bacterium]|nr:sugar MFS transporter [Flavobacteriales bacterium]